MNLTNDKQKVAAPQEQGFVVTFVEREEGGRGVAYTEPPGREGEPFRFTAEASVPGVMTYNGRYSNFEASGPVQIDMLEASDEYNSHTGMDFSNPEAIPGLMEAIQKEYGKIGEKF